jgi:hypothetical protein
MTQERPLMMTPKQLRRHLEDAYLAGWQRSGEGYNSEHGCDFPLKDLYWIKLRDEALAKLISLMLHPDAAVATFVAARIGLFEPSDAMILAADTAMRGRVAEGEERLETLKIGLAAALKVAFDEAAS